VRSAFDAEASLSDGKNAVIAVWFAVVVDAVDTAGPEFQTANVERTAGYGGMSTRRSPRWIK